MSETIDGIENLKALARKQSAQGQYEIEAKTLHDCIEILEAALAKVESHGEIALREPADKEETLIAAQLADLYGMLGGARRKQGDLMRSLAAYDQGFWYESNPRYRIVNTYNALNRLVIRILMYPGSLTDSEALRDVKGLEFVDVPRTLNELQTELKQEVEGARSGDFWAYGDLAFTCALKGDEPGVLDALQRFEACSPPQFAYSAYISGIGSVAELDTPRKEFLNWVKALFENRMKAASSDVQA